ncbi:MAG TPA: SusD/RagB family nutrient-binding outer membrane lipoprotein [Cyclobacteriaceae bacterium]
MKFRYKILLGLAVAIGFTACNLDINEDPNRITDKNITGTLLLVSGYQGTAQRIASGNLTFLHNWLGYWANSGSFAIDQTETTYNITPGFGNTLWANQYNTLFDLTLSKRKSLEAGDSVAAGAAIILSARLWQDLVDIYGNIPYSKAFSYTVNPHPAYDNGEDIYKGIMKSLDSAIMFMGAKALVSWPNYNLPTINGKALTQTQWIQWANTLKLRLLIHQSEVSIFDENAELVKIDSTHAGFLDATVYFNPGYTKSTNKQSPFYANYGKTVADADAAPSVKANNYFLNLLDADGDVREDYYFTTPLVGNTYGAATGNPLSSSGVGAGLAKSNDQDAWLSTDIESYFLQAEAIIHGWTSISYAGTKDELYQKGVTASFDFLGADASDLSDYLASYPYPGVNPKGFDTGTTDGELKALLYEKYKSMCGIDVLESWTDLRRIGYDILPDGYISVNPSILKDEVPSRLLLPQNEYTTNSENALKQGTINQFTSKIFWDVN